MKESQFVKSIIATTAIIALSVPAIASAAPEDDLKGKSVKVSYADLNLENEAGAKSLYRRLQNASKEACGVVSFKNAGSVRVMSEMQRCYRDALTAAVKRVDSDNLTKIHES